MKAPSEDIKDMLVAALLGTFATDLFISALPDEPDACVCVFDTGGISPQPNAIETPTVQIIVRGAIGGYQAAYEKAKQVRDELHEKAGVTQNNSRYLQIWCDTEPASIGPDEKNRPLLSVNFRIMRTATT